jgi:hypothetical protein
MQKAFEEGSIDEIAQVIHLTTAFFLIVIGCNLEYSNSGDIYVLLVSLSVVIGKLFFGINNLQKSSKILENITPGL